MAWWRIDTRLSPAFLVSTQANPSNFHITKPNFQQRELYAVLRFYLP